MKLLLIYINPNGFDEETKTLVKLQIDNSLDLGWNKKDIFLITNFDYEYKEIKTVQVAENTCHYPFQPEASKITTIIHLFDMGFFKNELYWFHDFDAYQLESITEEELELNGFDAGFTDYGRKPNWNTGSFFFRNTSKSI